MNKELLHHDVKWLDVCGEMLKRKLHLIENKMCSIVHVHALILFFLKSLPCFSVSVSVGLKKSVCLNLKCAKFKMALNVEFQSNFSRIVPMLNNRVRQQLCTCPGL